MKSVRVLLSSLPVLLIAASASAQAANPVPRLDFKRFSAPWYEIEHLPLKSEKQCGGDTMVLFAQGDKPPRFTLVTSCPLKDATADFRNQSGKAADKSFDGRLKLAWIWPFSTRYWVLALGPDYEWALVGTPNHRKLWILSKTATLPPDTLAQIRATASQQGFDVAKLVHTPQTLNGRPLAAPIH